jgi:DNA modification methylase
MFENGYIKERSEKITIGNKTIDFKKINKHYLVNKKKLNDLYNDGEIIFIDDLPYRKTFKKAIGNLWDSDDMLDDYNRCKVSETYDTPKPLAIVERIINICSNEGDTIADFFLGGGSTAVAAKKLNRKGIYCDINKKACDVTIKKLNEIQ